MSNLTASIVFLVVCIAGSFVWHALGVRITTKRSRREAYRLHHIYEPTIPDLPEPGQTYSELIAETKVRHAEWHREAVRLWNDIG